MFHFMNFDYDYNYDYSLLPIACCLCTFINKNCI